LRRKQGWTKFSAGQTFQRQFCEIAQGPNQWARLRPVRKIWLNGKLAECRARQRRNQPRWVKPCLRHIDSARATTRQSGSFRSGRFHNFRKASVNRRLKLFPSRAETIGFSPCPAGQSKKPAPLSSCDKTRFWTAKYHRRPAHLNLTASSASVKSMRKMTVAGSGGFLQRGFFGHLPKPSFLFSAEPCCENSLIAIAEEPRGKILASPRNVLQFFCHAFKKVSCARSSARLRITTRHARPEKGAHGRLMAPHQFAEGISGSSPRQKRRGDEIGVGKGHRVTVLGWFESLFLIFFFPQTRQSRNCHPMNRTIQGPTLL